jgi:hypothetical protein
MERLDLLDGGEHQMGSGGDIRDVLELLDGEGEKVGILFTRVDGMEA